MLRKCLAVVLILGVLLVIGCATHVHKVGNGAQGDNTMIARQWYVIAGLMPINKVDTNTMVGGATDYEIRTTQTIYDTIVTGVTLTLVSSRTVFVRK